IQRPHLLTTRRVRRFVAALAIALCGCGDAWRPPRPIIEDSRAVTAIDRCAECHQDIVARFAESSHLRTLARARPGTVAERFAGRSIQLSDGTQFTFRFEGDTLVCDTSCAAAPVPLHWIFGSGHHAQTPLATWPDELGRLESTEWRVSWYPDGDLGSTLGFEGKDLGERSGPLCMGNPQDRFQTRQCFACHSTLVPERDGVIDQSGIVPGVSCSRCHFEAVGHATAQQNGGDRDPIEKWSDLSPSEAIGRCGECHRRADQFTPQELTPSNRLLVRFAPVGLELSACFRSQTSPSADGSAPGSASAAKGKSRPTAALVCTSCHDPHAPQQFDRARALRVCHRCHVQGEDDDCPAEPATSDCLRCHMPKVAIHPKLRFTDHWIRVHRERPRTPPAAVLHRPAGAASIP
ncbi:MAG: hypothetical protein D6725_11660, partial [Planctomycetota bacterium]